VTCFADFSIAWVCYVYQNRYVSFRNDEQSRFLQLYDFDPLRVRKELSDRKNAQPPTTSVSPPPSKMRRDSRSLLERLRQNFASIGPEPVGMEHEGRGTDGVQLVMSEVTHRNRKVFVGTIKCGSALPYLLTERPSSADTVLLDGERIVTLDVSRRDERGGWIGC